MDFIYKLYENDNFVLGLSIVLVVLVVIFALVYFLGKKDQKLEETKRLQKLELDLMKKEEEEPVKVEVKEEDASNDVNVTVFSPEEVKEDSEVLVKQEEVILPQVKDIKEDEKPISLNDLDDGDTLEEELSSIRNIKDEFDSISVSHEEKEEEKPIFKPSPQIFSSVFVNKNDDEEKEISSDNDIEEKKETNNKLFSIIEDDDEVDLPSLKSDSNNLDDISGEVYEIK